MEEQNTPVIEIIDNEGNRINAQLYDMFELEGQRYALLIPCEEEEEGTPKMIAVMRLMNSEEGYYLEEIADDEEYTRVEAYLQSPAEESCTGHCNSCSEENHCSNKNE